MTNGAEYAQMDLVNHPKHTLRRRLGGSPRRGSVSIETLLLVSVVVTAAVGAFAILGDSTQEVLIGEAGTGDGDDGSAGGADGADGSDSALDEDGLDVGAPPPAFDDPSGFDPGAPGGPVDGVDLTDHAGGDEAFDPSASPSDGSDYPDAPGGGSGSGAGGGTDGSGGTFSPVPTSDGDYPDAPSGSGVDTGPRVDPPSGGGAGSGDGPGAGGGPGAGDGPGVGDGPEVGDGTGGTTGELFEPIEDDSDPLAGGEGDYPTLPDVPMDDGEEIVPEVIGEDGPLGDPVVEEPVIDDLGTDPTDLDGDGDLFDPDGDGVDTPSTGIDPEDIDLGGAPDGTFPEGGADSLPDVGPSDDLAGDVGNQDLSEEAPFEEFEPETQEELADELGEDFDAGDPNNQPVLPPEGAGSGGGDRDGGGDDCGGFWGSIGCAVSDAAGWVGDTVGDYFDWAADSPIMDGVRGFFNGIQTGVEGLINFAHWTLDLVPSAIDLTFGNAYDFLDDHADEWWVKYNPAAWVVRGVSWFPSQVSAPLLHGFLDGSRDALIGISTLFGGIRNLALGDPDHVSFMSDLFTTPDAIPRIGGLVWESISEDFTSLWDNCSSLRVGACVEDVGYELPAIVATVFTGGGGAAAKTASLTAKVNAALSPVTNRVVAGGAVELAQGIGDVELSEDGWEGEPEGFEPFGHGPTVEPGTERIQGVSDTLSDIMPLVLPNEPAFVGTTLDVPPEAVFSGSATLDNSSARFSPADVDGSFVGDGYVYVAAFPPPSGAMDSSDGVPGAPIDSDSIVGAYRVTYDAEDGSRRVTGEMIPNPNYRR